MQPFWGKLIVRMFTDWRKMLIGLKLKYPAPGRGMNHMIIVLAQTAVASICTPYDLPLICDTAMGIILSLISDKDRIRKL